MIASMPPSGRHRRSIDVQPRAEAGALAVQHDRAHAGLAGEALGGGDDRLEHRESSALCLSARVSVTDRDVVRHLDPDALFAHRTAEPIARAAPTVSPTRTGPRSTTAAVDPERQRLGACRARPGSCRSMSSVGRSTSPVSGSRLVIRQRPTWPPHGSPAPPIRDARPDPRVLFVGVDAVDLDQHPEAPRVDVDVAVLLRPAAPATRARSARRRHRPRRRSTAVRASTSRSGWPT